MTALEYAPVLKHSRKNITQDVFMIGGPKRIGYFPGLCPQYFFQV